MRLSEPEKSLKKIDAILPASSGASGIAHGLATSRNQVAEARHRRNGGSNAARKPGESCGIATQDENAKPRRNAMFLGVFIARCCLYVLLGVQEVVGSNPASPIGLTTCEIDRKAQRGSNVARNYSSSDCIASAAAVSRDGR